MSDIYEGDGFDEDFLGVRVPFPTFSDDLSPDVLRKEAFVDEVWTPYIHFSVVTNRERRQPIAVALNVDQNKAKSIKRRGSGHSWRTDPRVGDAQLDNAYYRGRSNLYDRGHMARRATAAWGDTVENARKASEATMVYTNAALQHQNLNQDGTSFNPPASYIYVSVGSALLTKPSI